MAHTARMGGQGRRLAQGWVAVAAVGAGALLVPVMGAGLAGALPVKDGWIMLAILLTWVAIAGAFIGVAFPHAWWLGALVGWPIAFVAGIPLLLGLGAGWAGSRLRRRADSAAAGRHHR